MDYQEFDLTPYDETSAQIGEEDFSKRSKLEYYALIDQLIRMFGSPADNNCSFKLGSCPHDFGTYYELRVYYKEWNEYMDNLENDFPSEWDEQALVFLREKGYFTEDHPERKKQDGSSF